MKFSEKTKYRYVYLVKSNQNVNNENTKYKATVCGQSTYFKELDKAARWVDLVLIKSGKEPINILTRL